MNIDELLQVVDDLSPDEFERLKAKIEQRENAKPRKTEEQWMAEITTILDDFWEGTPDEEREAIIEAMKFKNPSSNKGL